MSLPDIQLVEPDTEFTEEQALDMVQDGRLRPLGNKVLALRCTRDNYREADGRMQYFIDIGQGKTIETPDIYGDYSNHATLLAIGPDCKNLTEEDIGSIIRCPEWEPSLRRVVGELWSIKETGDGDWEIPYVMYG